MTERELQELYEMNLIDQDGRRLGTDEPKTRNMRVCDVAVPSALFDALRELQHQLNAVFGVDYAYLVAGGGRVLAQSNIQGIVVPRRTDEQTCAGCGERWPCSVASNRSAYRPDVAAAHYPASEGR